MSVTSQTSRQLATRLATVADRDAIGRLHEDLFGPGRFTRTAYRIRERAAADARLEIVALKDTSIVGALMLVPVRIGTTHAAWLGPIVVQQAMQASGVGRALMQHAIAAARERNCAAIGLVGDPPFYENFGFRVAEADSISLPGPVDPARTLVLTQPDPTAEMPTGLVDATSPGLWSQSWSTPR